MKRITLIAFLSFIALPGFAQLFAGKKTYIGLYAGGGLATSYNYDVAISGGLDFVKCGRGHFGAGFNLFYQTFGIAYDNEAYGVKGGSGNAGVQVLHKSSFIFLAPKFDYGIGVKKRVHFYVNVGPGFGMGGTEAMRKWDHGQGLTQGNYDSTIDTSPKIATMLLRVGTGFTEYLKTGTHWRFTITEEFGFVSKDLSSTADYFDPSRTQYSPRSMKPGYVSIQIGISHMGFKE